MAKSPLTDTQLIILSAAAQREGLRIELPERLRGGAARAVLSTLLAKGLIETDPDLKDEHATPGAASLEGAAYRISAEGLAAISIESEAEDELTLGHVDECVASKDLSAVAPVKAVVCSAAPRARSKLAQVIGLLERAEGASVDELTAMTGWLAHTTRAALTGLRKRGVVIERVKRGDGTTCYRIAPAAPAETIGGVV